MVVGASSELLAQVEHGETSSDLEALFCAQYERIARVLARIVRDPARAEELAVEVFLKLWRKRPAQDEKIVGWLYRTAIRMGMDELRRRTRRSRHEAMFRFIPGVPTPEDLHSANQEQERVRLVLSVIAPRHAELLSTTQPGSYLWRSCGRAPSQSRVDRNPAHPGAACVQKGVRQAIWRAIARSSINGFNNVFRSSLPIAIGSRTRR
jgi:RNA polymerase sigma factor (sigma-70 family)